MSFPVVFNNTKYYVDFKHDIAHGAKCTIWEETEQGEELLVFSHSVLKYPDTYARCTGRKMALKSALNKWYMKQQMPRTDFRALRSKVYEAMWAKMKMCPEDRRFSNDHNS